MKKWVAAIISLLVVVLSAGLLIHFTSTEPTPEEDSSQSPTSCTHEHTVDLSAVEPTCTETGLTAGRKCLDCGLLEGSEVIPALGHREITIDSISATCTGTGLTEGKKCSVCGLTLQEQSIICMLAV